MYELFILSAARKYFFMFIREALNLFSISASTIKKNKKTKYVDTPSNLRLKNSLPQRLLRYGTQGLPYSCDILNAVGCTFTWPRQTQFVN